MPLAVLSPADQILYRLLLRESGLCELNSSSCRWPFFCLQSANSVSHGLLWIIAPESSHEDAIHPHLARNWRLSSDWLRGVDLDYVVVAKARAVWQVPLLLPCSKANQSFLGTVQMQNSNGKFKCIIVAGAVKVVFEKKLKKQNN